MDVLLGAGFITAIGSLAVRNYGTNFIEVGLFDGAAAAKYEVDIVDSPQWVNYYYPERMKLNGSTRLVIRDHFSGGVLDPEKIELVSAANENGSCVVTAMVPLFGGRTDYASSGYGLGEFWHGIPLTRNLQAFGASSPAIGPQTNVPPQKFFAPGNEISKLHVYRDGAFVTTIDRQWQALSLAISGQSSGVTLSGNGTYANPLSGKIELEDYQPNGVNFTVSPSGDGIVRLRVVSHYEPTLEDGLWLAAFRPLVGVASATVAGESRVFSNGEYGGTRFDYRFVAEKNTPYTVSVSGAVKVADVVSVRIVPLDASTFTLTEQQRDVFSQQGSYFIVGEYDNSSEMSSDNSTRRGGSSARAAQQLYNFVSFVVVTEKPAVAVRQLDDVFLSGSGLTETVVATTVEAHFEDPGPVISYGAAVDSAGNEAFSVAPATYIAHERPGDGRIGAKATFVLPEPSRTLVMQSPLQYIDLVFDKPVSGVTKEMFLLERQAAPNGEAEYFDVLVDRDATAVSHRWRVLLPTSPQAFNTQLKLVFTPTSAVAAYPARRSYTSKSLFPPSGMEYVIYVDAGAQLEFVWNQQAGEYRAALPSDYEERGTTKLAARFMWAIGKDKSIGRFAVDANPDGFPRWIQKQVTQTETITLAAPIGEKYKSRIGSSRDLILPAKAGQFRAGVAAVGLETFVPRMPLNPDSNADGASSVAYFGMPTTIYPSARRSISECDAPSSPQIHASLFFGNATIDSITVTLKTPWTRIPSALDVEFSQRLQGHSMPCSSISGGYQLPQNMWVYDQSVSFSQTHKYYRNVSGAPQQSQASGTITNIRSALTAIRGWQAYPDMETSTVSQLCLLLSIQATIAGYQSASGATLPSGSKFNYGTRLMLTKEQEMDLVAGSAVDVDDTEGSVWTLQAQ